MKLFFRLAKITNIATGGIIIAAPFGYIMKKHDHKKIYLIKFLSKFTNILFMFIEYLIMSIKKGNESISE